jgi:hypothetical protein
MLTLIAKDDDHFQVWDTNGRGGFVQETELESGIEYGDGAKLLAHNDHDMLFLRRK